MPQRQHCLTDIGGPFYDTAKPFRNWSSLPYYQLDLEQPPYVDLAQLERGVARATAYLQEVCAQGYTGVVIDNLSHLVRFDRAGLASPIYSPESPYYQRATIYREAYGRLFDHARELGMQIFVASDMQWCTPPMRDYAGRLSHDSTRLQQLNRWALEELFTALPQLSGLVVRVGETGGAHDHVSSAGLAYTGHMLYTSVEALQGLIDTLLPVCERHGRLLILRSWSIGIGELGDLMYDPGRYRACFGRYRSPHLLVSIKHGPSDFFRMLPHNQTLGLPGPRQIVELQNRREYELFGMVPSSVAALHQQVMQHAAHANAQFSGIWAWNSTGGWGGGHAALGEQGWTIWTRLSSALTAALLDDPALQTRGFVERWCAERFGAAFGAEVALVYLESERLIEQCWYSGTLAAGARTLGSIYLPSLLWVWWMRPTAALPIWAYLAAAIENPEPLIGSSATALELLAARLARLEALALPDDPEAAFVLESVRYLQDVLCSAHAIRSLLLPAFQSALAGDRRAWLHQLRAVAQVETTLLRHRERWASRADFPPLELDEIVALLGSLRRAPGRLWLQSRAAALLVRRVARGQPLGSRQLYLAGAGASLLLLMLLVQHRPGGGLLGMLGLGLATPRLRQCLVGRMLPWLSRRFYLLPSIFFETGPSVGEWAS